MPKRPGRWKSSPTTRDASCSSAVAVTLRDGPWRSSTWRNSSPKGSTPPVIAARQQNRTLPPSPAQSELMTPRPLDPRPKAVLFDLDDTLCDYAAAREARLRRAFTLSADGGIPPRLAADLDRMIAESIRMHPHGADHFEELFARFDFADARAARVAADW